MGDECFLRLVKDIEENLLGSREKGGKWGMRV